MFTVYGAQSQVINSMAMLMACMLIITSRPA